MEPEPTYPAKIDFCLQQNLLPGEDWSLQNIRESLAWDGETFQENLDYVDLIYDREMRIAKASTDD